MEPYGTKTNEPVAAPPGYVESTGYSSTPEHPSQPGYPPQYGYPPPAGYNPAYPVQQQPQQQQQAVIITRQGQQQHESKMVLAVLVTHFCFWPTGLAAIMYADRANTMARTGNTAGAVESNKNASRFIKVSIGIGIFVIVITVVILLVLFLAVIPNVTSMAYRNKNYIFNDSY